MTPDYKILLGGSDATTVIKSFFNSIKVRDQDGTELDTAEITLKHSNRIAIPDRGTDIEILLGYKSDKLFSVFKGVINGIGVSGSPDILSLKATGLGLSDQKRLQESNTRAWNDKKLGDIVSEIISTAGFQARVHKSLSNIRVKRMLQTIETDIEFLQKIADYFASFLKSDGETIALLPARSRESVTGQPLPPVEIFKGKTKISEFEWDIDYRDFSGKITAFYQDDGQTHKIEFGDGSPETKLKQTYATEDEAESAIERELTKQETKEMFSVSMPGQNIAVGSMLKVSGFPNPISGDFWIRSVSHNFGNTYTIRVEAER